MMKQINLLIALLFTFSSLNTEAQDMWIPRDSVNGPGKSACTAFSIGLTGYIGLGLGEDGYKRSFYSYDPIQDDWDKITSLGGAIGGGLERVSPVSFVVGDKAYVGLGKGYSPYYKDFWEYDPTTDSWTQKADFGGTARRQAVAFTIDSMGYVGTGIDANGYTSDFWKYDPTTNTWSSIADFGGGNRKQAVAFAMDGKGYVGTGDNGGFTNDFWAYTPSADLWSPIATFPGTPRYAATVVAQYPDAIVGLGYDNTLSYKADLWRYNAINNNWVQLADFEGGARSHAVGFVIQKHAYIGCGFNADGKYVDDFYEYGTLINTEKIESKTANVHSKIYPNPSTQFCTIELDGLEDNDLSLEIFNSLGQEVSAAFDVKMSGSQNPKFQLITNNNPNGIYYFAVKSAGQKIHSGQLTIYN